MKLLFYRQDALANWCTAVGLADSLNATLKPQLLRVQLSMQGIVLYRVWSLLVCSLQVKVSK